MPSLNAKNIALTPQLMSWVDELVQTGEYSSASEVMRDGLRALQERRERHAAELAEIRARIAKSLDQADRGEFAEGSGEEAICRAFDTAYAKLNERGPGASRFMLSSASPKSPFGPRDGSDTARR